VSLRPLSVVLSLVSGKKGKSAKRERQLGPRRWTQMRYRIDTVFGKLVERFHAKRVWACDLWHLTSHWMRKYLFRTLAVFFFVQAQQSSYLKFPELVPE
jgi:hypothetical protein